METLTDFLKKNFKVTCSVAFNYDETLEGKASIYVKLNNIFSILDGIVPKYGVKKDY
jgi:hypothetical protein